MSEVGIKLHKRLKMFTDEKLNYFLLRVMCAFKSYKTHQHYIGKNIKNKTLDFNRLYIALTSCFCQEICTK
jgi:hypothetical protein